MSMALERINQIPIMQGETRRKLLLLMYLVNGSKSDDKTSNIVGVGQVDYMILKT